MKAHVMIKLRFDLAFRLGLHFAFQLGLRCRFMVLLDVRDQRLLSDETLLTMRAFKLVLYAIILSSVTFLHVVGQVPRKFELASACGALVPLLVHVYRPEVGLQAAGVGKAHVALGALEGSFPGVRAHVFDQRRVAVEHLQADVAPERVVAFLPRPLVFSCCVVVYHVFVQRVTCDEAPLAMGARELSSSIRACRLIW